MAIFQDSILKSTQQDENLIATRWLKFQNFLSKVEFVKNVKEEKYQDGFLHDLFEECLGYTLDNTNPQNFNLEREKKNETDGKKADGVIYVEGEVVGIVELKDQKSKNLDAVEAQAFNYHASHSNSKYIIISNFDELRFYIDKKTAYEKFNLFYLTYEEFKKLHLLLSYESIKDGLPLKLKEKSANFEQQISKELYRDFSIFRNHLFENIVKNNFSRHSVLDTESSDSLDKAQLLRLTQKLCDRIIFILFAEDRGLLRHNTIKEIREEFKGQKFTSYALYDIYKFYFNAINEGNEKLSIPKYNGGLFAKDEILDSLIIDDEVLNMEAQKLSDYDFASEISVNILGHIFEQSLSDLEEIQANIDNADFDKKQGKRKKDGVFYTPEYITRYIVENTLGRLCEEKRELLHIGGEILIPSNSKKLTKAEQAHKQNILDYREWLTNLKILDPACGSGAFLNQALEFLIKEHTLVRDMLLPFEDLTLGYEIEKEILEHNLYGVDINEDAVEIAKLSLWLRTAHKGRELTGLAEKIKCGNSLIDDNSVAQNAFVWEEEFAEVFTQGGFDVVIGNPPYGVKLDREQTNYISKHFDNNLSGELESYIAFYYKINVLLKENGIFGYITPDTWMTIQKAKTLRTNFLNNYNFFEIHDRYKPFEDAKDTRCHTVIASKTKKQKYYFDVKVVNYQLEIVKAFQFDSTILNNTSEWNLYVSQEEKKIFDKMKKYALLDEIINIKYGLRTGDNEKYLSTEDTNSTGLKIARGSNIERYLFNWSPEYLLSKDGLPASYFAEAELKEKIILQYVRTNSTNPKSRWLEACLIEENNFVPLNSTSFLYDKNNTVSLKYVLVVLSSYLLNYYYKAHYTDVNVKPLYLAKLPIPNIEKAKQEPFIQKADKMLSLKKQLQETKQNFTNELGLEKLTKKLQNFEELEFEEFVSEYAKAKKLKLADKLHERNFKQEWQAIFENDKISTCRLKDEIAKTDKEIDEIVYKLYDLSEDEIGIVEGV